jgi:hypothetical protein
MRGVCTLIAVVAGLAAPGPAMAGALASREDNGITARLYRAADKTVLCLSTHDKVHLSGDFGIHVSWTTPGRPRPGQNLDLKSKTAYFAPPVRLDLPVPRDTRTVQVEVGACVENDSCNPVEFRFQYWKLTTAAPEAPSSCEP